jgi:hypothetical protein
MYRLIYLPHNIRQINQPLQKIMTHKSSEKNFHCIYIITTNYNHIFIFIRCAAHKVLIFKHLKSVKAFIGK